MKLAVVLPSRGLIFSKTVEELYRELELLGGSFRVFFSHGRPIPDCFNIPTEEALKGDYTHILFVEEDMVLPEGVLTRMLAKDAHAIACDYPVSGGSGGTVMYDTKGKALFTGCGLLLVKAELLRRMPKPIWRTDIQWKPHMDDGIIHFTITLNNDKHYGQQDVAFGLRLYANGLPIEVLGETIGQREMVEVGEKGSNTGYHVVRDRLEISERKELMNVPVIRQFRDVVIDGRVVKVRNEHFKKLDNPEQPAYIRAVNAVFLNHECLDGWIMLND